MTRTRASRSHDTPASGGLLRPRPRLARPGIAAILLFVASAVAACGGSSSTPTPQPTAAPASPSATGNASGSPAAPGSPGPCASDSLTASGGPWGGAAGSRGADITVRNTGAAPCVLPAGPTVAIVDSGGNVLVQSRESASTGGPTIQPSGSATFSALFGNWCNQAVALPLRVRLGLTGGSVDIAGLDLATTDDLPPCNGPGQSASLSATEWQVH